MPKEGYKTLTVKEELYPAIHAVYKNLLLNEKAREQAKAIMKLIPDLET